MSDTNARTAESARQVTVDAMTVDPVPLIEDPGLRDDLPQETVDALRATWKPASGFPGFLSTVQNGPMAKRYIALTFVLFLIAGSFALLMRTQLAVPQNTLLGPERYNQLFTMHGSTMMYLVAVPMLGAFVTLLLPQMIGTRDMPFPRMTALGFWGFLFSALFFYASFVFRAAPNGGWFAYVPLTGRQFSPGLNMDFWLLGLGLAEVASMGGATEFIVAILKTRAPGMSLNRMPIFAWSALTLGFMILFGFTPLLVGTTLLELDRLVGTQFFNPARGGNALLWQHLFWIFGHPEVYIQFIPATGMISMIVPTMARRAIVGYTAVVVALIGTGVMSFGLWVHHMFTTGIPLMSMSFFTASSLVIAILSGVQIFAWIATLWGGRPQFTTPLLFVLGMIFTFVIGGITGVMVASAPFDWQVHDTFFVVAHFHYVLIGGVIFPLFAAFYYWMPKVLGKRLGETLGKWNFWLLFIGVQVAFLPMHISGLRGMPRRVYTYQSGLGWSTTNLISTIGAYMIGLGVLVFIWNVVYTWRCGRQVDQNPWRAGTLDWASPTPLVPPPFFTVPIVRSRYPLWEQRGFHEGDERAEQIVRGLARSPTEWRAALVTSVADAEPQAIVRVAGPSYWPISVAVGLALVFGGLLASVYWLSVVGLVAVLVVLFLWFWPDSIDRSMVRTDGPAAMHGLPIHVTGRLATGWWAMIFIVLILAVALASTVFSYYYLRVTVLRWPPPGVSNPGLLWPAVATALVLVAAAAMRWAETGAPAGDMRRVRFGLLGAWILGALFLGAGWIAYGRTGVQPTETAYGSIVLFTLAFQGVVALVGLLISAHAQAQAWAGYVTRWRWLAVQNAAHFWYFVAASWLIVAGVIYGSPYVL